MKPLRLALVVLGLALAVYGTASLTGGWLGTPPWWGRVTEGCLACGFERLADGSTKPFSTWTERDLGARPELGGIGGVVIVVGLVLAALGAWPRRRGPAVAAGAIST